MRISDPNGSGNLGPAQSGRTGQSDAVKPSANNSSLESRPAVSDGLELSSFAGRLSASLAAHSASRAERVAQLTAAVRSGTFQTDPARISHAIVDHSLGSGSK